MFSFISQGGGIYKNAARGYKKPMEFVFTKMSSKATNGSQTLYCKLIGYAIGP
jgi:hypothetical protein